MSDTVYNKIVKRENGVETVLIDLDSTTLSTSDQLLSGVTAHNNAGVQITGTGVAPTKTEYSVGSYMAGTCTSYVFPSTVTSVRDYAFYGCTNLTSINIPNVTSVGEYAFEGCSGLTTVNLSSNSNGYFFKSSSYPNLTTYVIKNGVSFLPQYNNNRAKIGSVNGHMYEAMGTNNNVIYCDGIAVGTLKYDNLSFTDEYGVTFTRTAASLKFTITW